MSIVKQKKTALVVLSGGQDSITCLGWALAHFENVHAISFNYNQRHVVELEAAARVAERYNVPHRIVALGSMLKDVAYSALTDPNADDNATSKAHPLNGALPASFVPGRNAMFLTLAHAFAQQIGAAVLVTGVCQTDFSGYPDCRHDFVAALERALNIGYATAIAIATPLMFIDKAATFALAVEVGVLEDVLEDSHTCYNGDHETRHEWGYGCGECPACKVRAAGWKKYQEAIANGEDLIKHIR